jgi:hypothetical protein
LPLHCIRLGKNKIIHRTENTPEKKKQNTKKSHHPLIYLRYTKGSQLDLSSVVRLGP